MTERVTLKPGDYVSTEGMTEDQYHAVARAFMAAGATSGEYPNYSFADEQISCPRWSFGSRRGALFHGLSGCFDGRHLTPAQVIGAVNAGTQQEEDNMEHKAGDRFIATADSRFFSEGSTVRFTGEYGCFGNPKMALVSGDCRLNNGPGGTPGAIEPFGRFEKINDTDTLTQTLRDAAEHDEKAKHHAAEHDRLMQRARDMLPDGWMLVRGGIGWAKGEDMTDPANWRVGDVIEWIEESGNFFTAGKRYTILAPENPEEDDFDVIDDDNDRHAWDFALAGKSFRFHSRPTT